MRSVVIATGIVACLVTTLVAAPPASSDPTVQATHSFRNSGTDLCITNLGNGNVETTACGSDIHQKWIWSGTIPSTGTIRSAANSEFCLDSINKMRVYRCDGTPSQRWTVYRPAAGGLPLMVDGYGNCLQDYRTDELQTRPCDNTLTAQRWRIVVL